MLSAVGSSLARWWTGHPRTVDGLLGGALALLGIANLRHDFTLPSVSALPPGSSPTECNPVLEAVGFICVIAVFAVRRANPYLSWLGLLALNLAMPAGILLLGSGRAGAVCVIFLLAPAMLLGMPILLATIAALRSASASWVCTALCLAYPITAGLLEGTHDGRRTSIFIIFQLLLNAMGVLVGLNLRSQRERLIEIEERSARMALAREQTALLAAANERSRIAREMHDVVAHSLAVMITMADGATAAIDRNPQMARQALEALSEAGRSALADTRRLVGVLRDDPGASSDPGVKFNGKEMTSEELLAEAISIQKEKEKLELKYNASETESKNLLAEKEGLEKEKESLITEKGELEAKYNNLLTEIENNEIIFKAQQILNSVDEKEDVTKIMERVIKELNPKFNKKEESTLEDLKEMFNFSFETLSEINKETKPSNNGKFNHNENQGLTLNIDNGYFSKKRNGGN